SRSRQAPPRTKPGHVFRIDGAGVRKASGEVGWSALVAPTGGTETVSTCVVLRVYDSMFRQRWELSKNPGHDVRLLAMRNVPAVGQDVHFGRTANAVPNELRKLD